MLLHVKCVEACDPDGGCGLNIICTRTLRKNSIALIRLVDYRTFLICLGITLLFWLLIWMGIIDPTKQVLEIAAVVISGVLTIGLIGRYAYTRHLFLLWAAGFMAIAMSREIHLEVLDSL